MIIEKGERRSVLDRLQALFEERTGMGWQRVHLLGHVGSIAHGTHTPSEDPNSIDDVDFMGIVIPPPERVLGLTAWEHLVIQVDEIDATFYSLPKAMRLLAKGNPNVVGLLWGQPAHYPKLSGIGYQLIHMRHLFSTLACYPSFVGYAHGQLKRMESCSLANLATYDALEARLGEKGVYRLLKASNDSEIDAIATERTLTRAEAYAFRGLHKKFYMGYMGKKRKALVRSYGYDAKNASHMIRLLRMCCEFLGTGRFEVDRSGIDATELRAIKRGEWSLAQIKREAEQLFRVAEYRRERSLLPEAPDVWAIESLTAALMRSAWELQDTIGPAYLPPVLDEVAALAHAGASRETVALALAKEVPALLSALLIRPVEARVDV